MAFNHRNRFRRRMGLRQGGPPRIPLAEGVEKRFLMDCLLTILRNDCYPRELAPLLDGALNDAQQRTFLRENLRDSQAENPLTAGGADNPENAPITGNLQDWLLPEEAPAMDPGRKRSFLAWLARQKRGLDGYSRFPGLKVLKSLYGLEPREQSLVMLLFFLKNNRALEHFCLSNDWDDLLARRQLLGLSRQDLKELLDSRSTLVRNRLVVGYTGPLGHVQRGEVELSPAVTQLLMDGRRSSFFEQVGQVDRGLTFPLESFPLASREVQTLRALLQGNDPCHILFWGIPGSGKTSLARSLARALGKEAFLLSQGTEEDTETRTFALNLARMRLDPAKQLLVVDEAEGLLSRASLFQGPEKGLSKSWLNHYLDSNTLQIIWIVNDDRHIHDSVRRRFHFNLEFSSLGDEQRVEIWKRLLKAQRLERRLPPGSAEALGREYRLSTGSIQTSLEALKRQDAAVLAKPTECLAALRLLLDKQNKLLGLVRESKLAPVSDCYDPALLNTDADPQQVLDSLGNFFQARREPAFQGNMNILCSGEPGTGKTEWVKYLAQKLEKRLEVHRASDLLNPYVGMTEKLIADMFRKGTDPDVVLFIDEADSLFSARAQAQRSWEVTRTNELLTHMDQFTGVLICATNFQKNLDPAVLRRFAWKIQFRPLHQEGLARLLCKQFPQVEFSPRDLEQLPGQGSLSPGDIKAVWNRLRFLSGVSPQQILEALETETRYKQTVQSRPIGF